MKKIIILFTLFCTLALPVGANAMVLGHGEKIRELIYNDPVKQLAVGHTKYYPDSMFFYFNDAQKKMEFYYVQYDTGFYGETKVYLIRAGFIRENMYYSYALLAEKDSWNGGWKYYSPNSWAANINDSNWDVRTAAIATTMMERGMKLAGKGKIRHFEAPLNIHKDRIEFFMNGNTPIFRINE